MGALIRSEIEIKIVAIVVIAAITVARGEVKACADRV